VYKIDIRVLCNMWMTPKSKKQATEGRRNETEEEQRKRQRSTDAMSSDRRLTSAQLRPSNI